MDQHRVLDAPHRSRFEIFVGDELAGFAEYQRSAGRIAFTHTEIGPRFQGQGLADELARAALDSAKAARLEVLPFCPFVRRWMARHQEYVTLVPQERRREFAL